MKKMEYIYALALMLTASMTCSAARPVVRATIDSVTVEMGDRAMMHAEVIVPKNATGSVVGVPKKGSEHEGVEFLEVNADRADSPDGVSEIYSYEILFQAFEPRLVTMPRIGYADGIDTTFAEVVSLNVRPVDLDSLTTINPVEGTVSIPRKWFDIFPNWMLDYWYWIVLGILVAGLGTAIYLLYKKNGKTLLPRKKIVPPYEQAMMDLQQLRDSNLIEKGHIKEYYTRLTDILRRYLSARFGIYAPEMTSSQTVKAISEHPEASQATTDLRQLFRVADFVKFAKVLPPPDDNIRSFNLVKAFVEETRPAVTEEDRNDENVISDNNKRTQTETT